MNPTTYRSALPVGGGGQSETTLRDAGIEQEQGFSRCVVYQCSESAVHAAQIRCAAGASPRTRDRTLFG